MANPVIMPRQGQSVETCIITEWHKQKGDEVKEGDVLFSYETDKASFEETAKNEGTLLEVFYEDGDEVPVLTNVAVIGSEGESVDEFRPGSGEEAPTAVEEKEEEPVDKKTEPESTKGSAEPTPGEVASPSQDGKTKISPRARNKAGKLGVATENIQGTGPYGRVIERDIDKAYAEGKRVTPLAQQQAREEEKGIPAAGTGVGGAVTADDLVAANQVYGEDAEVKKLSNIRRIIAQKMHESLQNSAQLTHHMSADVRKLMDFRKMVKKRMEEGSTANITLNDMICYATIKAIKKYPEANSHFLGDSTREFKKVHLGLAVDTPRGLMVPALKNADDLSLQGLSSQLKAIAEGCRTGSIDPELLASTAASFTVSNLGNYGVEMFTPIINVPQVAILGVNTIVNRPADLGNGVFGFVPYIGLSLTYDHRAIDGGPATLFLREIKNEIENWNETL